MERDKSINKLLEGRIYNDMGIIAFVNMGQSPPSSYYNNYQIGLPFTKENLNVVINHT
ncbi:MAG: hypothetical protein JW731_04240 [Bacteroidales bacterium]|nr:hypothetical protein [Bacteroidales bacterium]